MKTKFETLRPWLDEILTSIKKDIRSDYLPADVVFYRTHFGSRPLNRLTSEEINQAFIKELTAGNEEMTEWVVNRWVFKHGEVYRHFAERLSNVNPDFNAIESLTKEQSETILAGSVEQFGAKLVYFFSMLNGVVFPDAILARLQSQAKTENVELQAKEVVASQEADLAKAREHHQRELTRITDKYETKLSGVLKKYTTDTDSLKAQVRALQLKLNQLVK